MNDYQPLTPKELERGYFFLTHRYIFKRAALIASAALLALIYGLAIYNLVTILRAPSFSSLAESISQSAPDWSAYNQSLQPVTVSVSAPQFISLGDRRYDLIAFINNPNDGWAVTEFQYSFVINNEELPVQTTFLNPGEARVIVRTGYVSAQSITSLKINSGPVKWRRFSQDTPIVDWEINNIVFQPVTRQTVEKESFVVPPRVTWDAKNMSLYDFWEVGWQVVLLSGDKVVGVKEYVTKDFNSLQSKAVEVVWLNDLPRVTKTLVYPVLDWLNTANFKRVGQ